MRKLTYLHWSGEYKTELNARKECRYPLTTRSSFEREKEEEEGKIKLTPTKLYWKEVTLPTMWGLSLHDRTVLKPKEQNNF